MHQTYDTDLARLLAGARQTELRHSRAHTRAHRTDRRFRFGRRWRRP
jgi:hypothetical protein